MTCIYRANLGQQRLRLRKQRGTTACSEKAQIAETVCGAEGQSKVCMAKARLLESQFAVTKTLGGTAERLTRYFGQMDDTAFISSTGRVRDVDALCEPACPTRPLYGGISERTGRLTISYPSSCVIAGYPTAGGSSFWPVWVRSCHITQTLGVMAKTAAEQSADGRRYKYGVTHAKTQSLGGRATISTIRIKLSGVC